MNATVQWSTLVAEGWPKYSRPCHGAKRTCSTETLYIRFTGADRIGECFCTPHAAELGCIEAQHALIEARQDRIVRLHSTITLAVLAFTAVMTFTMISIGADDPDYDLAQLAVIGGFVGLAVNMLVQFIRDSRCVVDEVDGGDA